MGFIKVHILYHASKEPIFGVKIAEEFYEVTDSSFELSELREELLEWEQVYNAIRPH